jgi:hypothetical protein
MSSKNFEFAVVVWLIGLSFWTGTAYMRIQHNEQLIAQDRETRVRLWDRLNDINKRLSIIQGKLESMENK